MQDSLPAGGLRLYREGVEPSGTLRKVSGYITILLSRTYPVARVVYAKRPFGGPDAVLAYLSRYTHRVAIANSRLIAFDGERVTFKWKDYRAKLDARYKLMTLDADEFIRRFLIHVLPDCPPLSNPHSPSAPHRCTRAGPRFPPSRLIRRLPSERAALPVDGQASDNP
jgi:hypothetical protein